MFNCQRIIVTAEAKYLKLSSNFDSEAASGGVPINKGVLRE